MAARDQSKLVPQVLALSECRRPRSHQPDGAGAGDDPQCDEETPMRVLEDAKVEEQDRDLGEHNHERGDTRDHDYQDRSLVEVTHGD